MPFESFFENIDGNVRQRSGITLTLRPGLKIGTSASPEAMNTASSIGDAQYYSSTATSGTTYGKYTKLSASGIGVEAIADRNKVVLSAAAANAHGSHDTLEVTSTGYVSGLGTAIRGNIVFGSDTVVPRGTYYAVMAEIYAAGNVSSMPAASNACLCCSVPAGTEIDKVANAIAFAGTDGSTSMIYSKSATLTATGYIRILVNGAIRYIPFCSATG